ncbi:MAG: hypothetical protein B7Z33_13065 [Sphingomonadales bacterium 12-68-11]|nr:MAG: hypothetical protein B7Z33_13065 [Sphingomonadales bacterium 12-68-11]
MFARWSALEKQLNQLFTLVTDADPIARVKFDDLKGWDRRAEAIIDEAKERLEAQTADIVKVVLRLAKVPAEKRDDLAHRIWAVAEGFDDELVLLPPDDQHLLAESVVAAKQAGTCSIPPNTDSIYAGTSLVSAGDLNQLIRELERARLRLQSVMWGYLYPPFADAAGGDFADARKIITEDVEITDRLKNVAIARRRAARLPNVESYRSSQ